MEGKKKRTKEIENREGAKIK
jgi:hypothetical protein